MITERRLFKISSGSNIFVQIAIPNRCVHCNEIMKPNNIFTTNYENKLKSPVAILYQCTHCFKYFAVEYKIYGDLNNAIGAYESKIIDYTYKIMVSFDLPEELTTISPIFKEIYVQSLTAQRDGLSQIAGIGYRKAIEFLIKDFLINFQNEDLTNISKCTLGQAIKKINSDKIRNLSTASVWVGNDETHYIKKYEDKDVNDMKKFIRALAYFITSELVASEAEDFINC